MSFDITSVSNSRIKRLLRLAERRHRDAEGVFIVEGLRLIQRAVGSGLSPIEIYSDGTVTAEFGVDAVMVAPDVLDRVSYRHRSQGLIAVFEQFDTSLDRVRPGPTPLLVAAEAIEKPGNFGALARIADGAGTNGLIAITDRMDPFNPNAIRSSTGAIFALPIALCRLDEFARWAAAGGMRLAAAHPSASTLLWDLDLTGPTCLLVGAEDVGLSASALEIADVAFSIPLQGTADSLNVAAALAISAFEAVRQRRHH